jgi:3-isopropylmalate/(R)-2-methylmalate dehydratase small subunit
LRVLTKSVKAGDTLEVDLEAGEIKNLTTKKTLKFTPLPDFLLEIMSAGGIEPYIAEGKINT